MLTKGKPLSSGAITKTGNSENFSLVVFPTTRYDTDVTVAHEFKLHLMRNLHQIRLSAEISALVFFPSVLPIEDQSFNTVYFKFRKSDGSYRMSDRIDHGNWIKSRRAGKLDLFAAYLTASVKTIPEKFIDGENRIAFLRIIEEGRLALRKPSA